MKKIFAKIKGLTLIELIIASMLISLILFGVISTNTALNNTGHDSGQRASVTSQTQTTLNHILNNAAMAVGSSAPNNEGILIGENNYGPSDLTGLGDTNSFCIHQSPGANILNNANEDLWLCYSL